jgi:hypothetical protein
VGLFTMTGSVPASAVITSAFASMSTGPYVPVRTRIVSPLVAASTAAWTCVKSTPGPGAGATTHTLD